MPCAISDTDRTSRCEPLLLAHTSQKYISIQTFRATYMCVVEIFIKKSKRVLLVLWSNIPPWYWLWQYFLYLKQPARSLPGLLQLGVKRKKWLTTPLILDLKNSSVSWPCKLSRRWKKSFFVTNYHLHINKRHTTTHYITWYFQPLYLSFYTTVPPTRWRDSAKKYNNEIIIFKSWSRANFELHSEWMFFMRF